MWIRSVFLVLLLADACCALGQQSAPANPESSANPSLDSILAEHHVPVDQFSPRELQGPITSWAVSKGDAPFLFAWYDDDGSGGLHEPLHVLRYTREHGVERKDLRGNTDKWEFSGFTKGMPGVCFGAALSIDNTSDRILISTHINPSAGCVLILQEDMSFQGTLFGWVLGIVDGALIAHENEVHFAPFHQEGLGVFDIGGDQWVELYPIPSDPLRIAFADRIKPHMPTEKWCQEHDMVCDASNFEIDVSDVLGDPNTRGFRFDVSYSAHPLGEGADNAVGGETHSYSCGMHGSKWECALVK